LDKFYRSSFDRFSFYSSFVGFSISISLVLLAKLVGKLLEFAELKAEKLLGLKAELLWSCLLLLFVNEEPN